MALGNENKIIALSKETVGFLTRVQWMGIIWGEVF